ncbi:hypothetical protein ISG33_08700 [Glaciecola sp. MH2013]|uniref:TfuA-like protein n=1 Tax=Glaciecola sp. MH2013 TaxID=2785524 RepID=UPI00189DA22C|nr:TfuA-like protein [Glaciecola sp. MH2013]MBF7073472.1 hypothetical protein [Glaciecola sp. MH2013]
MNSFVFIGPTISVKSAEKILDATYLPPIAMGDLYTLIETKAKPGDCVAIVDGLFEQVPAIWHKEILYALSKGIHVFGASSMGALRAAELHTFGMQGIGDIFEAYRDGILEDDDEVTVGHGMAADGYKALSHSMASLRFGLAELLEQKVINAGQYEQLIDHSKSMYYTRRSWGEVYQKAKEFGLSELKMAQIKKYATGFDAKRSDAIQLLEHLKEFSNNEQPQKDLSFDFQNTVFWVGLCQAQQAKIKSLLIEDGSNLIPYDEISKHARALHQDKDSLLDRALLLNIVDQFLQSYSPSSDELKLAQMKILESNSIRSNKDLQTWLSLQKVTNKEWLSMIENEAKLAKYRQQSIQQLDPMLIIELKRLGQFSEIEKRVSAKNSAMQHLGVTKLTLEDANVEAAELQQWYETHSGKLSSQPEEYAKSLGFETLRDFIDEILGAYISEEQCTNSVEGLLDSAV